MTAKIEQLTREQERDLVCCIRLTDAETLLRIAYRYGIGIGYGLESELFDCMTKAYFDGSLGDTLIFAEAHKSPIARWFFAMDDSTEAAD